MKIGLVCQHYLSTKGGLERYTLNLSTALARRGHEVHIFCNTGKQQPGIRLHHVSRFPISSPGKNISFALNAARAIAEYRLDIVQSMERIWQQDIFRVSDGINPVQMQEKYPHPLWRAFKAAGPRRQVLARLEKRIFERGGAQYILAISNMVKEQVMAHYQVPDEKVRVIYNSVDNGRFNPATTRALRADSRKQLSIGEEETLLLFMGNDFRRKGLHLLLEALVKLKKSPIQLLVAGSDRPAPYIRFATRNGIGQNVRFIGFDKRPEKLYAAADVFVLPTKEDTFGNVSLEAMASGLPVIATHTAGSSELVDDDINGYVVKTRDADELAARIKQLLPRSRRLAMGAKAVEKASSFTMDHYLDQLFLLYEIVIEAKFRDRQR